MIEFPTSELRPTSWLLVKEWNSSGRYICISKFGYLKEYAFFDMICSNYTRGSRLASIVTILISIVVILTSVQPILENMFTCKYCHNTDLFSVIQNS